MFESQYNDEMEAEVKRLEAQMRAVNAGHPEWANACKVCGCEISSSLRHRLIDMVGGNRPK